MVILIAKLDEEYKNVKSSHLRDQTIEGDVEEKYNSVTLEKVQIIIHNMLYCDCVSSIFKVFFLIILACSPFGWQIKPACMHF